MPKLLADERVFPLPNEPVPRGAIVVSKRLVEEDDGSTREQFIWVRGKFVVVVPMDECGSFILKEEFKYAQMQNLLTFPSGGIGVNEEPEDAARRELREELGMVADGFVSLSPYPIYNSPDKSTEHHFIFLARNTRPIEGVTPESGKIMVYSQDEMQHSVSVRIAIQRLALYEALRFVNFHT